MLLLLLSSGSPAVEFETLEDVQTKHVPATSNYNLYLDEVGDSVETAPSQPQNQKVQTRKSILSGVEFRSDDLNRRHHALW